MCGPERPEPGRGHRAGRGRALSSRARPDQGAARIVSASKGTVAKGAATRSPSRSGRTPGDYEVGLQGRHGSIAGLSGQAPCLSGTRGAKNTRRPSCSSTRRATPSATTIRPPGTIFRGGRHACMPTAKGEFFNGAGARYPLLAELFDGAAILRRRVPVPAGCFGEHRRGKNLARETPSTPVKRRERSSEMSSARLRWLPLDAQTHTYSRINGGEKGVI